MTEITDIHRIAYARVQQACNIPAFEDAWAEVRKLLPSELTNPQPVLPTEPGWYACDEPGAYGGQPWELRADGTWWVRDARHNDAQRFAPFTRLVPERPQITREQIESACTEARADRPNPPQVYAILALVNGADQ